MQSARTRCTSLASWSQEDMEASETGVKLGRPAPPARLRTGPEVPDPLASASNHPPAYPRSLRPRSRDRQSLAPSSPTPSRLASWAWSWGPAWSRRSPGRFIGLVLGGSCSQQPQRKDAPESVEPLLRFIEVGCSERGPIAAQGHGAGVPMVGDRGYLPQQRFDFGNVVDEMIGHPADGLMRGIQANAIVR